VSKVEILWSVDIVNTESSRFHTEGRIVRHLFTMLFWSVIFMPAPGAFETPYQVAPLDLSHDSFYFTRRTEIERRLEELEKGEATRILIDVDDRERPNKTFAIGVRWDDFSKDDTVEIVEVGDLCLALDDMHADLLLYIVYWRKSTVFYL
jgi:hypothetical protein